MEIERGEVVELKMSKLHTSQPPRFVARPITDDWDPYQRRRIGWLVAEGETIHARGGWLEPILDEFWTRYPGARVFKLNGWNYSNSETWPDRFAEFHRSRLDAIGSEPD